MMFEILIYDGFDDLDAIGVLEPMKMSGLSVCLKSLHEQSAVKTSSGTRIIPHGKFDLQNSPDVLIVPGGGWLARSSEGAYAEAKAGQILSVLRSFHAAGGHLAAVCTGVLLLGKAGLLAGRPATTNHAAISDLESMKANIVRARIVDDYDIVTAGGITSSIDLGLWLVKRYCGAEKSREIAILLEFEPRGPVWTRESWQKEPKRLDVQL